jgi:osmotically-inducible protein OsmY
MNRFKRSSVFLAAAVLLAVAGCASNSAKEGEGSYLGDAAITTKVKTAIYNEPSLKVNEISVKTENNVVQLSGSVKSRADRSKAGEVASKVEGVRRVKNDLALK